MKFTHKIWLAIGLCSFLLVAAAADMFLTRESPFPAPSSTNEPQVPDGNEPTDEELGSIDTVSVVEDLGFEIQENTETFFTERLVGEGQVDSMILLKNGDRAGLVAWTASSDAPKLYSALKEALHETFSPDVHDLVDEIHDNPGEVKRMILTFQDPALSEERLVFIQVRNELFEFHVPIGKEEVMFEAIEALTNEEI